MILYVRFAVEHVGRPDLRGATVRDPSLTGEIGRVISIQDDGAGWLIVGIELDESAVQSRLRERRGAF